MRLPLLPILTVFVISVLLDVYLAVQLRRRLAKQTYLLKLHLVLSSIFNGLLFLLICVPKRSGADSGLNIIMWGLYIFLTVYVTKLLFVIFDLLASIPMLWHKKRLKLLDYVGGGVGLVVFVAMWWGALVNRYNIDVREVQVEIEGLPAVFDGYRIVQLSDLHVGSFGSDTTFVSEIVDCVNALNPDLVTFTGDIVNRRTDELVPFVPVLSRLDARDGVYSIMGNHDYGDYYKWSSDMSKEANLAALFDIQKSMGWKMLNNSHDFIYHGNDSIALIGVENVGDAPFRTYGDLDAAYPEPADPNVKILLTHNPAHWVDDIKDSPDKNIALTLSGHTHAMQMCIGGVSPAALRYDTWGGLYKDDDKHQLYVNIGAGEVGMPARIGATPEITLIRLKAK